MGLWWIRHETKPQMTGKRYSKGHRKVSILFSVFFALFFIDLLPGPSEACLSITVVSVGLSTAHSSRWLDQGPDGQNWTCPNLQGQDRMHSRILRKLTNVTVIWISSSEGHSSQVKYPGSHLYSQKSKCLTNLTVRELTQKMKGKAKTVIYHKFREFFATYHSVLVVILN